VSLTIAFKMITDLLSSEEKNNVLKWQYKVIDNSISTKILTPFWDRVLENVPVSVAPNLLTLLGLICVIIAFYLCMNWMWIFPRLISLMVCLLLFAYQTLDAIDGKQARRIKNSSPIGELFDHVCDNISNVLIIYVICQLFNIQQYMVISLFIQAGQWAFINCHLDALVNPQNTIEFGTWIGPGELLLLVQFAFFLNALRGPLHVPDHYFIFLSTFAYCVVVGFLLYKIRKIRSVPYINTKIPLVLCIFLKTISLFFSYIKPNQISLSVIICDGLAMTIITSDLILAKMAKRNLHPLVLLCTFISVFDDKIAFLISCFYHVIIFYYLCDKMSLPMFSTHRNVYMDLSTIKNIPKTLKIINNNDKIIIGHEDTEITIAPQKNFLKKLVRVFKNVHKIIDRPHKSISEEFVKKYNLHVIICSEKFNPSDKQYVGTDLDYYKIPREMEVKFIYLLNK
jgi:phosphatidylglycerophosphate synthase